MRKNLGIEIFGWYGAAAILLAFALASFGVLVPQSLPYQILNLTGAAGIVAASYSKKDYQPAALNLVWALVALVALLLIVLNL
jgi:hypothetical protein